MFNRKRICKNRRFLLSLRKISISLRASDQSKDGVFVGISGLVLHRPHRLSSREFKSAYVALCVMNYPSPCNHYPKDDTSPAFNYYIAITMKDFPRHWLVPPVQNFTARSPTILCSRWANHIHSFRVFFCFFKEQVPLRQLLPREMLLCGTDSQEEASQSLKSL